MGRNYHCEYCDKRFKDDVKIRQKHLKGQAHQTARREHYAKYKSAREILEEESHKRKCAWFQSGYCQFGSACRSSHYTEEQLAELRQQAAQQEHLEWQKQQPKQYSSAMVENFMTERQQRKQRELQDKLQAFFDYPQDLMLKQHELPPSLRMISLTDLTSTEPTQWGGKI